MSKQSNINQADNQTSSPTSSSIQLTSVNHEHHHHELASESSIIVKANHVEITGEQHQNDQTSDENEHEIQGENNMSQYATTFLLPYSCLYHIYIYL